MTLNATHNQSSERQHLLSYFILIIAVLLAYANVYENTFLFDDELIITHNSLLLSWKTFPLLFTSSTTGGAHIAGGFFRPMQNIVYFFVYQIFGESTFGFHLLNIVIHAANACLLYTLGRRLNFNTGASFAAALIWALHPIQTEAVTYMSGTADPLFAMLCLIGLLILLPDFAPKKFLCVIPVFLLALLTKETAIVFPLLVAVTMYCHSDQRLKPKFYIRTWPLWLIAGAYAIWRVNQTAFDGPATYQRMFQNPDYFNLKMYSQHFEYRLYTFFATLPNYFKLLVWPIGLHMERNFRIYVDPLLPEVVGGFFLFLVAGFFIFAARGKHGLPFVWGLLWFASAHFLNSGLLVAVNALFLEHWMYLPTMGLFLGSAQSISTYLSPERMAKIQPFLIGIICLLTIALGFRTYDQNGVWLNPITFYANVFKYGEVSARAHNNLALAYMQRGEYEKAINEYHRAIAITDTYAETRHNLAVSLLNMPDPETHIPEAIENLQRALQIDPHFYRSYQALAQIYAYQGDKEKAAYYQKRTDELLQGTP